MEEKNIKEIIIGYVLKLLAVLGITFGMMVFGILSVLLIVNYGPSENAHKLFVKSVRETSAIGFLADWFTTPEELDQILTENTIIEPDLVTDTSLIHINIDNSGDKQTDATENEGNNGALEENTDTGSSEDSTDESVNENGDDQTPDNDDDGDDGVPEDENSEEAGGISDSSVDESAGSSSAVTAQDGIGYKAKDVVSNENGIIICEVSGTTYTGHMMIVEDPSRVIVGVCDGIGNDDARGQKLADIIEKYGAVAGINAGGFEDENGRGTGSIPLGCAFSEGNMLYDSGESSLVIGFDNNHILHVENMDVETAVAKGIRDAVTFRPALIVNGQPSGISGTGSGLNPRTAIGQRSDGAVLLLVIDGRQANSLGASYADLIKIMQNFGAVNAANLDGGSSSLMLYKGSSVSNPANLINNRYLPTSFIVK